MSEKGIPIVTHCQVIKQEGPLLIMQLLHVDKIVATFAVEHRNYAFFVQSVLDPNYVVAGVSGKPQDQET